LRAPTEIPAPVIAAVVALSTAVFGGINFYNSAYGAPQWSQDLAFFHQWVHSAAAGGPWASPLILEPQGFFEQVHTHLILPFVVGAYTVVPAQATLIFLHSFFVSLAVWPALRLGSAVAGGRHAFIVVLAVLVFGPFQSVAIADFRPVGLFIPGILGVWAAAWKGSFKGILFWSLIALFGRQEASYLLASSGMALLFCSWGDAKRTHGSLLIAIGFVSWLSFTAVKPEMFFHINPLALPELSSSSELWDRRTQFGIAMLISGWWLGVLRPAPLFAALPVFAGMLMTGREWHALTGPGAHHHAFWIPFVLSAGIAGSARLSPRFGAGILALASGFAFPWASITASEIDYETIDDVIPAKARVAADYDTIHRVSGRQVLWNIDQLYMSDQPWHWTGDWPLTIDHVDWIISPNNHAIQKRIEGWYLVAETPTHQVHKRVNRRRR